MRLPGAEGCIGTRELAEAVEQRLGREVFAPPARAEVAIDAYVGPAPPGFRARITLSDARGAMLGTRELESAEAGCRALDEKIVLVMAMLLDPEAALAPMPPARPAPITLPAPLPLEPPPPPRPWKESLSLGPVVAAGLLPGAAVGLSLRGEMVPPAFVPIELGGIVWLDARATAPTGAARGAELSLAYGTIGVCPLVWGPGATVVRGCTDLGVGAVRSVGFGFAGATGAGQEQPLVQAQVAGRVTRRLAGPLDLGVGLGLAVPFARARLYYVDATGAQQELFRTAPVAGVVEASLGLAFP